MGVLLIRELPDTVKEKETEAEVYSAVWDLMIELERIFQWLTYFMDRIRWWRITTDMMKLEFSFRILSS